VSLLLALVILASTLHPFGRPGLRLSRSRAFLTWQSGNLTKTQASSIRVLYCASLEPLGSASLLDVAGVRAFVVDVSHLLTFPVTLILPAVWAWRRSKASPRGFAIGAPRRITGSDHSRPDPLRF
jgi:hypothetical protein